MSLSWPPNPPRRLALGSAGLLLAISAALLLYPSVVSPYPADASSEGGDPGPLLDILYALAALFATVRPATWNTLLTRTTTIEWRDAGLFRSPPNSRLSFRPGALIAGLLLLGCFVNALASPVLAISLLAQGQASWHLLAQVALRPLVAWTLAARVA
ncbi:MAG TPA: hypothetical protein VFB89_00390, partial [Gemmatimonadales bacterium]|nr:hypothetical protein [Gemmatimonadales bacterium]